MLRLTDVVKNLLILNVVVYIVVLIEESMGSPVGLSSMLALHYPESDRFMPVQLVTHFFMHGGHLHIFFNMFALAMFGPQLEDLWGPKRFLLFYFICAFGAAALHLLYSWWDFSRMEEAIQVFAANPTLEIFREYFEGVPLSGLEMDNGTSAQVAANNIESGLMRSPTPQVVAQAVNMMQEWRDFKMNIPIVGASGAIYGVLLGFGMQFPNQQVLLLFPPMPVRVKFLIPIMIGIELYLGFRQYAGDNIAHFAHLGGALTGFLLILYWRKFDSPWRGE